VQRFTSYHANTETEIKGKLSDDAEHNTAFASAGNNYNTNKNAGKKILG